MSDLSQDLRYGLRKLRSSPGFTLVAVLTLAIGIGANTVMFGIVDASLFRPPAGVSDASRLMRVELALKAPNGPSQMTGVLAYPDFVNVRDRATGFAHTAAFARTSLQIGRGDEARTEPVMLASGDYFATLGTRAAAGRLITVDDDRENAAVAVAVLGWEYFQRAYSGDARVLGQSIVLNGHSFTIIGVAPKNFAGIDAGAPSIWVPLGEASDLGYDPRMVRSRYASWLSVVGRLAPNASLDQARASVQAALLAASDEGAEAPPTGLGPGGGLPSGGEVRVQIGGPGGRGSQAGPPPTRRVSLTKVGGAVNAARPGRGGGRRSLPV